MENEELVVAANESFYKAFNARDLDAMKRAWGSHEKITCVHPGWAPLNGIEPIIDSWQGIFKNSGNMDIQITDVRVTMSEGLAWISCIEKLYTIATNGVLASQVYSTNLFQLSEGDWKMIMHHASPLPSSPESEEN
jgi:ketosteroid isomerase-like protein